MIATNRRIPANDFLLVAVSVAVIMLSNWPAEGPRQRVQVRDRGGALQTYSFAENDPTLAKLKLELERWVKAGQETRLAVAQWRAELAQFYADKTEIDAESTNVEETGPFRTASHSSGISFPPNRKQTSVGESPSDLKRRRDEAVTRAEHQHWLNVRKQADAEIGAITEIRRSRKALEVPPPVVLGKIESGQKPWRSVPISISAGLVFAGLFGLWAYLCPLYVFQLAAGSGERESEGSRDSLWDRQVEGTQAVGQTASTHRLELPMEWVRLKQPSGVVARWLATGFLVMLAVAALIG